MAHYAFLDENNIVTEVIVGVHEDELLEGKDPETWYGEFRGQVCKRTSYNATIRKNYAGIGFVYREDLDAFIAPQPFLSWTLDEETCQWAAPIPYPSEGVHIWREDLQAWEPVVLEQADGDSEA